MKAGWVTVTINDLVEVVTKGTTPTSVGFEFVEDGLNFIKIESISESGRFIPNKFAKIDNSCHAALQRSQLEEGDILFSIAGALGRTALVTADILPANTNQALALIRLKKRNDVDPSYVYHSLSSGILLEQIEKQRGGVAQQNLSLAQVKAFQIPLPPLEEQHQIVAVLDEAFEGLSRARAHAEANLRDARELLANTVDRLFEAKAGHETRQMRLGSIVTRLTNGYVGPTRNIYVEEGVPYLLARHVRNNQLNFDGRTFITQSFNEKHKKSKLQLGDVLLVQSGHIGHCAVVPPEHVGHNCHAMIIMTTIPEVLSGDYLSEVLNTPRMQERFQEIRTGSTVPHLTCRMVKELMVPVPTLADQGTIIDEIQGLRAECDDLERRYRAKLQSIEALQKSLLQRAFTGELT